METTGRIALHVALAYGVTVAGLAFYAWSVLRRIRRERGRIGALRASRIDPQ